MGKQEEKNVKRYLKECGLYAKFVKKLKEHNYYLPSVRLRCNVSYKRFIKECEMIDFIDYAFVWDSEIWCLLNEYFRRAVNDGADLIESSKVFKETVLIK